ncbi:MAG: DUF4190 domain-containing protein [Oscillospiraceae bacterium]|jgi:hypothetical protein|nr:DUF4190 domain-containing protein [Oscillospiraceae bacterium]
MDNQNHGFNAQTPPETGYRSAPNAQNYDPATGSYTPPPPPPNYGPPPYGFGSQQPNYGRQHYNYGPGGYGSQPYGPGAYAPGYSAAPKSNGISVASLVLGIASLMGFAFLIIPPIVGLCLGIASLVKSKTDGKRDTLAIVGVILSAIGLLIGIGVIVLIAVIVTNPLAWREFWSDFSIDIMMNVAHSIH